MLLSFSQKIFFLLVFTPVFALQGQEKTVLPSTIQSYTELSAANSPYQAQGSVTIEAGAELFVQSGVEIEMPPNASFFVHGSLTASGTEAAPIEIHCTQTQSKWGYISSSSGTVRLEHTSLQSATRAIAANYGSVVLLNCTMHQLENGDGIAIHYADSVRIEHCQISGTPAAGKIDAIDCDGVANCQINHNQIYDFGDDAIDIGTHSTQVEINHNFLYNCLSMGISVGESSTANLSRNIIFNCFAGIQSHTGSSVTATHNTLYSNQYAIHLYHQGDANSAGNIQVLNSILSQSALKTYLLQQGSPTDYSFDYTLSDTDTLPGTGNLQANPLFVAPEQSDFTLQSNSPCIDAGHPQSPTDPDGSRADIGALPATSTHIAQNFAPMLRIFPNPAHDFVFLQSPKPLKSIHVFSPCGKKILSKTFGESQKKCQIALKNLPKGLVFLKIQFKNQTQTSRALLVK